MQQVAKKSRVEEDEARDYAIGKAMAVDMLRAHLWGQRQFDLFRLTRAFQLMYEYIRSTERNYVLHDIESSFESVWKDYVRTCYLIRLHVAHALRKQGVARGLIKELVPMCVYPRWLMEQAKVEALKFLHRRFLRSRVE